MSLIDNELKRVWDQLRGDKPHRQTFLEEIAIRNLRGITDLRVPLEFPVTVLAGENACGKSTVLFGCACAYKMPAVADGKSYVPTALFPSFTVGKMDAMKENTSKYGALLAIGQAQLETAMQEAESILSGATTSESEREKGQLQFLAERLQKHETEIARLVARQNTEDRGEIIDFATDLEDEIRDWRNLQSQ